jgi:membrane-anchored protein YejM (alkaline phosphatase superfamily)
MRRGNALMNSIHRERARSLKFVQIVFAVLALVSLVAALAVSTRGVDLGLPERSTYPIALAFLLIGVIDTVLLFAWEHIFQRIEL